jgi:hypothetical protein
LLHDVLANANIIYDVQEREITCVLVWERGTEKIYQLPVSYMEILLQKYDLPADLYGCETWSLILRMIKMMKVIFRCKKEEVSGVWKKMHNEELCNSCPYICTEYRKSHFSPDVSQIDPTKDNIFFLSGNGQGSSRMLDH